MMRRADIPFLGQHLVDLGRRLEAQGEAAWLASDPMATKLVQRVRCAGPGRHRPTRSRRLMNTDMARHGRLGLARLVMAWRGSAGHGPVRQGSAGTAWIVLASQGLARLGEAGEARRGPSGLGGARRCLAWRGRRGVACPSGSRHGEAVPAWRVVVWRGESGQGTAGRGKAGQA